MTNLGRVITEIQRDAADTFNARSPRRYRGRP